MVSAPVSAVISQLCRGHPF